ncbi:MAG: phosphotransferase enzyme family protein [Acidimicrobiales bacterium]
MHLVRSKYRIGESLRVVHRIMRDGVPATVTGRVFPGGTAAVAVRSPAALRDTAHDSVWWTFPDDRKLCGVEAVMQADPNLAQNLGVPAWASSEVAEYAPERSLTVRAEDHDGGVVAYVKLYAAHSVDVDRFAARYERVGQALAAAPLVSVPRVLGRSDTAIAISGMAGVMWNRAEGDAVAILAGLGSAIAHFHGTPPDRLAGPFGRLHVPRVLHSAELVAVARPELAASLQLIAHRLAAGPPAGDPAVLLHGDCHPKNCLVDGERLALIDLDQAGIGSAACDLASLLAGLHHSAILGETDAAQADRLGAAFLDGYAAVRALPGAASLRWHYVAALVAERCIRSVNRVNLRSLERLDALVQLAVHASDPSVAADLPGVSSRAFPTSNGPR